MCQLAEELKESTWSWFEIRQFLRWGVKQGILTQEKSDGIAQLLDFLETQSRDGGIEWSLSGDVTRLERLTLESWQFRIPRTAEISRVTGSKTLPTWGF